MKNLFVVSISLLFLLACEQEKDPKAWIDSMKIKKATVDKINSNDQSLSFDDQLSLKEYFTDIAELATAIKKYPEKQDRMIQRSGLNSVATTCRDLMISRADWNYLNSRCTYHGYYICSEELRAYPSVMKAFKESLNPALKQGFENSSYCPKF